MRDQNLAVLFLDLRLRKVKWKLFLGYKNDVCVGALSVNFPMHFTVGSAVPRFD